jgi:hypothetical protein
VAYRHWEEEMLGEYVAARLPGARVMMRVRLGPEMTARPGQPPLDQAERRFLTGFRRWADAVAVDGGRLLVLEAAMIPQPGDISLLEHYCELVPSTPDLDELATLPCVGRLVWAIDDPAARKLAVRHGLEVDIFRPSHWLEFAAAKIAQENGQQKKLRPAGAAQRARTSG